MTDTPTPGPHVHGAFPSADPAVHACRLCEAREQQVALRDAAIDSVARRLGLDDTAGRDEIEEALDAAESRAAALVEALRTLPHKASDFWNEDERAEEVADLLGFIDEYIAAALGAMEEK